MTAWWLAAALAAAVLSATPAAAQPDPQKRGGAQQTPDPSEVTPRALPLPAGPPIASRCPELDAIRPRDAKEAALVEAVRRGHTDAVPCGSVATVVGMVVGSPGALVLDRPTPVNATRAQAELGVASRRADVRTRLERVARDAGRDDRLRLVYEATVLDEHGLYHARDLKLVELRRRLE